MNYGLAITFIVLLLCLYVHALSNAGNDAEKALKAQGYTQIKLTGHKVFACSRSDDYNEGFEATSIAGVRVQGVVCMGFVKGSTIRTF